MWACDERDHVTQRAIIDTPQMNILVVRPQSISGFASILLVKSLCVSEFRESEPIGLQHSLKFAEVEPPRIYQYCILFSQYVLYPNPNPKPQQHVFVYLSSATTIQFIYLFVCVCLFVCLLVSLCLFIYLFVCLFACLFACLLVCLFVCLCFVCVYVCVCVCLCLFVC